MKKNYIIPETKTHQLRTVKVIAASPNGRLGSGYATSDGEVLGRSYDFDDDDDYDY